MPASPDILSSLDAARWTLEGKSDFWSLVLQISTVAVGIGVIVEVIATIMEIFEDRREGKPLPVHAVMTLLGGALVAIALAFEFVAEFQAASIETSLRKNNAAAQGELDKRAREATAQAVAIAGRFGGLQKFVAQKEGEIDSAFSSFRAFADRQQARTTKALSDLSGKQAKLQTALNSVDTSASKAASAADTASKTAISMTDTLNSERQMSAQMRAIITHRTLSDTEIVALAEMLKPFARTPFDLFVSDDPESRDLVLWLKSALAQAGWEWRTANATDLVINTSDGKQIGIVTVKGIFLEIAESSKPKLEKPVVALFNALTPKGWALRASAVPDEKMDKRLDHNVVHIFVGSRD